MSTEFASRDCPTQARRLSWRQSRLTQISRTVGKQRKEDSALAVASNAVEPRLLVTHVRALCKPSAAVCAAKTLPPLARLPLELAEPAQERLRHLSVASIKGEQTHAGIDTTTPLTELRFEHRLLERHS
jgi:hypothetical protein